MHVLNIFCSVYVDFFNYIFVKFWTEKEIDQAPNSNASSVDEENSDGEQPGVRTTGKSDKKKYISTKNLEEI